MNECDITPVEPFAPVEGYVRPCECGGGGGGTAGIFIGYYDSSDTCPSTRPDGTPLEDNDFFRPKQGENFPFTICDIEFKNRLGRAVYSNGRWNEDPGLIQDTSETPLYLKTDESISGNGISQRSANVEFVNKIGKQNINEYLGTDLSEAVNTLNNIKLEQKKLMIDEEFNVIDEDGNTLTLQEIFNLFNAKECWIFIDFQNIVFLPTTPNTDNEIHFIGDFGVEKPIVAEDTETKIENFAEIIVKDDNKAYYYQRENETTSYKVNDINVWLRNRASFLDPNAFYPTVQAVVNYIGNQEPISIVSTFHPEHDATKRFYYLENSYDDYKKGLYYCLDLGVGKEYFYVGESDDTIYITSIDKKTNYLYFVDFDKIPELEYSNKELLGGCTTFIRDGKMYRSYDYKYDETAEFFVRYQDFQGMAYIPGLKAGELTKKDLLKLPFSLVDGVNKYGIKASIHLLENDFNATSYEEDDGLYATNIIYYILSNLTSCNNKGDVTSQLPMLDKIYYPQEMIDANKVVQVLISDGENTFVYTPADMTCKLVIQVADYPKITNFAYYDAEQVTFDDIPYQAHGQGKERYNMIDDDTTLEDLKFTKCYEDTSRLSEFIGMGGTDKNSTEQELTQQFNIAKAEYDNRIRDGKTWHSKHGVIYDGTKAIELYSEEDYATNYLAIDETTKIYDVPNSKDWKGQKLPKLTKDDIITIADYISKGTNVIIRDKFNTFYSVVRADKNDEEPRVEYLFNDGISVVWSYTSNGEVVTYKVIEPLTKDGQYAELATSDKTIIGAINETAQLKNTKFKGYVSLEEPTGYIGNGEFWLQADEMPTLFPINVKVFGGSSWSEDTQMYDVTSFDLWADLNTGHGYYWFGNAWKRIDVEIDIDGVTIGKNEIGQIEVKDEGLTISKADKDNKQIFNVYGYDAETDTETLEKFEVFSSYEKIERGND